MKMPFIYHNIPVSKLKKFSRVEVRGLDSIDPIVKQVIEGVKEHAPVSSGTIKHVYFLDNMHFKLKPEECIFIDDLKETLKPARKLGMKTILFRNNKQLVRDLRKFNIKI